jgi:hypothetical protein
MLFFIQFVNFKVRHVMQNGTPLICQISSSKWTEVSRNENVQILNLHGMVKSDFASEVMYFLCSSLDAVFF